MADEQTPQEPVQTGQQPQGTPDPTPAGASAPTESPVAPGTSTEASAGTVASETVPEAPLADPNLPIDELPPGVAVGGTSVAYPDDQPPDVPVDENAPAPGTGPVFAQPMRVDGRNRLHGDDALEGHFAKIVDGGDDDGQIVVYVATAEYDRGTGRPLQVFVRFKDTTYTKAYAIVPYDSLEATPNYRGGA